MEVQFSSEVALPALIKQQVLAQVKKFQEKRDTLFDDAMLEMHLKFEGPQIECKLNFATDDGKYNASVLGWDVRQIVHEAVERIDTQIQKHMEKRSDGYNRRDVPSEML